MPAASSATRIASVCPTDVFGSPLAPSTRFTVETLTTARCARSRTVQPNNARAARTCVPETKLPSAARRRCLAARVA